MNQFDHGKKVIFYSVFSIEESFDFERFVSSLPTPNSYANNPLGKVLAELLQVDYSDDRKYPGKYGKYEREKDAYRELINPSADQMEKQAQKIAQRLGI